MKVDFEGADNLGKTTAAEEVCRQLNYKYVKFPNPNNYSGQILREMLQGKRVSEPAGFQALNIVDRLLTPLAENEIRDRYTLSGKIYGMADGLPEAWVDQLNSLLQPSDLIFVFVGTPFTTDGEMYDFNENVVQGYNKFLAENEGNERVIKINANRPKEEVVAEIIYWIRKFDV